MEEELKEAIAQRDAALAQAAAEKMRADAAEAKLGEVTTRADKAEGEVKGLQSRLDSLEEQSKDVDVEKLKEENKNLRTLFEAEKVRADNAESEEKINALVNERLAVRLDTVSKAMPILGEAGITNDMSDRDIKVAVITRLDSAPAEDAAPAFIDGCFAMLTKGYDSASAALAAVTQKAKDDAAKTRADSKQNDTRNDSKDDARAKFMDKQNNAWKERYSRMEG